MPRKKVLLNRIVVPDLLWHRFSFYRRQIPWECLHSHLLLCTRHVHYICLPASAASLFKVHRSNVQLFISKDSLLTPLETPNKPEKRISSFYRSPHPWSRRWSCTWRLQRWSPPGYWGWGWRACRRQPSSGRWTPARAGRSWWRCACACSSPARWWWAGCQRRWGGRWACRAGSEWSPSLAGRAETPSAHPECVCVCVFRALRRAHVCWVSKTNEGGSIGTLGTYIVLLYVGCIRLVNCSSPQWGP